jgi:L-amino acid N-acyltransferase
MALRLKIRPARESDAAAIRDIYNDAIAKTTATFDTVPKTLSDRKKWLKAHAGYPVLIAEHDGEVLGWASLSKWSDRCAYAGTAENSVYVAEAARGKGVGKALLAALMKAGKKAKLHTVVARISDGNEASVRLHAAFGFERVGVVREVGRKFGRLLDVHMMQAFL